jgi:hypothetical protein
MSETWQYDKFKWVIFIMDPDYIDSSPYCVVSDNEEGAIENAIAEWKDWASDGDPEGVELDEPRIVKVYRGGWIGVRMF